MLEENAKSVAVLLLDMEEWVTNVDDNNDDIVMLVKL